MTNAMDWLRVRAPSFGQLTDAERNAITDFSLLWGLFESRILNSEASANAICQVVKRWNRDGSIDAHLFDEEIVYFQRRYYADNRTTDHFDQLHLRTGDRTSIVCGVLNGSDADSCHRLSAALIIVYRYRNNLFHGLKWQYELTGQFENFKAANAILIKALDRHGGFL